MPCTPITHKYFRRWINWSKVAEIQAQRAVDKREQLKKMRRGGSARRGRG